MNDLLLRRRGISREARSKASGSQPPARTGDSLYEVEASDLVADGRQQRIAIGGEDEVSAAVNCAQQV